MAMTRGRRPFMVAAVELAVAPNPVQEVTQPWFDFSTPPELLTRAQHRHTAAKPLPDAPLAQEPPQRRRGTLLPASAPLLSG